MRHSKQVWITLSLTALLAFLMAACHKDPTPTPQINPDQPIDTITPNDTITPIIPTKEIVLDWNWERPSMWARSKLVEEYANQPDVKSIELKFIPANTSGYGIILFQMARDSLDLCASKKPDIITWTGTIVVGPDGASLPRDTTGVNGMCIDDSARFAQFGANIVRYDDWNGRAK